MKEDIKCSGLEASALAWWFISMTRKRKTLFDLIGDQDLSWNIGILCSNMGLVEGHKENFHTHNHSLLWKLNCKKGFSVFILDILLYI